MLGLILFIIGLSALILATILDIKTREIPNWLSYTFISLALVANLIYSVLENDYYIILRSFLGFAFFFIIGNIMYYTQQWGGGDAKLVMGLGAAFYTYPQFLLSYFSPNLSVPFTFTLFINILIIGSVYSIVWAFYLMYKHFDKFTEGIKVKLRKTKKIQIITVLMILLFIIVLLVIDIDKMITFTFSLLILFLLYLMIAIKTIDEICMYKIAPIIKLTEGDWIPKPIYHKGKIIIKCKAEGLTKKDILLLKTYKIKEILIREGIPFVPSLLLSFIVTIIFGFLFTF